MLLSCSATIPFHTISSQMFWEMLKTWRNSWQSPVSLFLPQQGHGIHSACVKIFWTTGFLNAQLSIDSSTSSCTMGCFFTSFLFASSCRVSADLLSPPMSCWLALLFGKNFPTPLSNWCQWFYCQLVQEVLVSIFKGIWFGLTFALESYPELNKVK